ISIAPTKTWDAPEISGLRQSQRHQVSFFVHQPIEGGTAMAPNQYSTLLATLEHVPDPRKARGKRYPWTLLLTIIVAGLASNDQTARAMAPWAQLQATALPAAVPGLTRLPSASTIWRTLRQIDAVVLEQQVVRFVNGLPPA